MLESLHYKLQGLVVVVSIVDLEATKILGGLLLVVSIVDLEAIAPTKDPRRCGH